MQAPSEREFFEGISSYIIYRNVRIYPSLDSDFCKQWNHRVSGVSLYDDDDVLHVLTSLRKVVLMMRKTTAVSRIDRKKSTNKNEYEHVLRSGGLHSLEVFLWGNDCLK